MSDNASFNGLEAPGSNMEYGDELQSAQEDDIFKNNHDLIGV